MKPRVTHIPLGIDGAVLVNESRIALRTYCGRIVAQEQCINTLVSGKLLRAGPEDCIEDATCKSCGRSDDRRQRKANPPEKE